MNYTQALEYLQQARGIKMGLERVQELLHRAGNPQERVPVIHIAGTNGKGSVGAMLAAVLKCAGYQTGHFSSPALLTPREYFRLNGEVISEERFAQLLTELAGYAEQMQDKPTEFELLAAMAYLFFAEENCEVAVVECCMGGDTDCTNVLTKPVLSIITNIQLDHCAILGNTIEEIAAHKAGIIKQGCPVLTGETSARALAVIQQRARALQAPLFAPEIQLTDVQMTLEGTDFLAEDSPRHLALPGSYQLNNARLVLMAEQILQGTFPIPETASQQGLAEVQWPGRFEVFSWKPLVIFDGAHNPDGFRQTMQSIRLFLGGQETELIMGVLADKDYAQYPELLAPNVRRIWTVTPDSPRALDAQALAAFWQQQGIAAERLPEDFRFASPVVILGSLYLYPWAKAWTKQHTA